MQLSRARSVHAKQPQGVEFSHGWPEERRHLRGTAESSDDDSSGYSHDSSIFSNHEIPVMSLFLM